MARRRRRTPLLVLPEGVRLGVDVGSVRIGVAVSDPGASVALPLEVVRADRHGGSDIGRVAELASAYAVVEVVVGLPLTLRGEEGAAAAAARSFADRLALRVAPVRVRMVDERLSTVTATQQLRAVGVSSREGRGRVDASAAAVLLQAALDADRAARAAASSGDGGTGAAAAPHERAERAGDPDGGQPGASGPRHTTGPGVES